MMIGQELKQQGLIRGTIMCWMGSIPPLSKAMYGSWPSASKTLIPLKVRRPKRIQETEACSLHKCLCLVTWIAITNNPSVSTVKELLTAKEATPARIAALRAYVAKTAPLASPFLTDDDLRLVNIHAFALSVAKLRARWSGIQYWRGWWIYPYALQQYFSRKCFRGAIVKVNRLNIGEWAVLLGGR